MTSYFPYNLIKMTSWTFQIYNTLILTQLSITKGVIFIIIELVSKISSNNTPSIYYLNLKIIKGFEIRLIVPSIGKTFTLHRLCFFYLLVLIIFYLVYYLFLLISWINISILSSTYPNILCHPSLQFNDTDILSSQNKCHFNKYYVHWKKYQ